MLILSWKQMKWTCFNMSLTTSMKIRIQIENEASDNRLFSSFWYSYENSLN